MGHQLHETVIYVISKQIRYIVIEPQVSCWANSGVIWQSTESSTPFPSQCNVDVTVSPRPCDYKAQQGSESMDEIEINNTGVEVTNPYSSSSRKHAPENEILDSGEEENTSGT